MFYSFWEDLHIHKEKRGGWGVWGTPAGGDHEVVGVEGGLHADFQNFVHCYPSVLLQLIYMQLACHYKQ